MTGPHSCKLRRGSVVSQLTADDAQLIETAHHRRIAIPCRTIHRIHAYKRDLITTDEIRLIIESSGEPGTVDISEESPGFADLFGPMERALGVSPAWYREIMSARRRGE